MSTNCIKCLSATRTGGDLLCDSCRAKEYMAEMARARIKCAAIKHKGDVHEGACHVDIELRMLREKACSPPYPSGGFQGFVTEEGRFVSRALAREIAVRAGQVDSDHMLHPLKLFSEDL